MSAMKNPDFPLHELLAHDAWIRALARRLVHDEPTAEDVAQDTWVAALEHPPSRPGSVRAWLARIVRNLVRMGRRSAARSAQREKACAGLETTPSVAEMVERESARLAVGRAVLALEEPYRTAVLLRYFEDLPPREIAVRLDISPAAVEGRLRRGLEKLRARLDRECGDRAHWCAALLPWIGSVPAEVAAPAGSVAPTTSFLSGALVMSTKVKLAIVALLVIGLAFALWPGGKDVRPPQLPQATTGGTVPPAADKAVSAAPAPEPTTSALPAEDRAAGAATSPPTPAEPAGVRLTGTVFNETGQPIQGARVSIDLHVKSSTLERRWLPEARTTQTDAAGRFVFAGLHPELFVNLAVAASGYSRDKLAVSAGAHCDIVLAVGGCVAGRVVDRKSDLPVEGARVSAMPAFHRGRGMIIAESARTGADGRYRMDGLRPGTWGLSVYSPGHPPHPPSAIHEVYVVVERQRETVADFQLERGVTLRGQVVDTDGRSVAGARAESRLTNHLPSIADASGRFCLEGLPEELEVRIEADGKAPVASRVRFTPDECRIGEATRTFRLVSVARILGIVLGPEGQPLEGAEVQVWRDGLIDTPRWTTDRDGRFEATIDTPAKPPRLTVRRDELARAVLELEPLAAGEVREGIVVRMTRGGEIRGRVVAADGAPISGHRVWLRPWPVPERVVGWVYGNVATAEDGSFRFGALPAGAYQVSANGQGFPDQGYRTRGRRGEIRVTEGATVSGIVLTPAAEVSLRGRVVDDRDRPVVDVSVWASSGPSSTRTDANGRFVLEGLPENCPTRIEARKDDYQLAWSPALSETLVTRDMPELLLRMNRIPPGIRGRVLCADTREPVQRFWIRAHTELDRTGNVAGTVPRLSSDSRRRFFQSPDGGFVTNAAARGGSSVSLLEAGTDDGLVMAAPVRVQVDPDGPPPLVELLLESAGSVCGWVRTAAGEPVGGASVEARCPLDGRFLGAGRSVASADGRFEIRDLPPGPVEIRARHEDWIEARETARVEAGRAVELEIRLGAASATLHVQVRGPRDAPIAGARVRIFTPAEEEIPPLFSKYRKILEARLREEPDLTFETFKHGLHHTGSDGRLERRFLSPGDYLVDVSADGFRPERRRVTVRLDVPNVLELALEAQR
ncbi:MAG: sigma-70 family RNA polymerase sigma factor [Planctomycetes bacterium]|nr:sigma-70 family RNA polymerase sigma factor [Planctomycetota bacterium]